MSIIQSEDKIKVISIAGNNPPTETESETIFKVLRINHNSRIKTVTFNFQAEEKEVLLVL